MPLLVPLGPGEPTQPQLVPPFPDPAPTQQGVSDDLSPPSVALLADRLPGRPAIIAWGCEVTYEDDFGAGGSPVAGKPGTPGATWVIHGGERRKIVTFVAQASGGKPELPSPLPVGPGETFLRRRLSPQVPQIGLDGQPIVTVGGQYVFKVPGPFNPDGSFMDNYGVGSHPLSVLPPEYNTLNIADFKRLLASAQ